MRTYYMGDGRIHVYILCGTVLSILFTIMMFTLSICAQAKPIEILAVTVPFLVFSIYPMIVTKKYLKAFKALRGKIKMGEITEVYSLREKRDPKSRSSDFVTNYYVEYKYVNDFNKVCISKVKIREEELNLFIVGDKIPVRVNGEYSLFKIKEIRNYLSDKEKQANIYE